MSAFNRIKSVAAQLKSEKPKERQEGIQSLRDIFKHEQVIHKLDDAGDGRAWLFTFQALFETVLHEKRACLKKGLDKATPVAVRKLREAAQTLRWLTERSVTRLSRKVVKALFSHILQMVVYKESLFEPVAFDYIKALRAVLTYQPHLDHLEPETWTNIVFFCFNVLLGDVVDSKYNLEEDGSGESHEEVEDSDEDGEEGRPSGSKKRARRASPPGAHASTSASVSVSGLSRHAPAVSLEQIECAAIVSVLLNSASAPYLADPGDPAKLPRQIFKRLNRFFETYPTDTSAHQDMISALNAALQHLELNTMSLVTSFGIRIWSHLLSLWGTKTKAMKEGIVIALRTLFPLLAHSDQQPEFVEGITRFAKLMDAEVELRGGLEALSLDSLRLEIGQDESKRGAFETKTFRVGNQFEGSHALAWAALELQADCLAKLFVISESMHLGNGQAPPKRTKVEDPIQALLTSTSQPHASSAAAVFRLQVLLFFIDRHWNTLHPELQQTARSTLVAHLSSDDPSKQSWSFLCLGAICSAQASAVADSTDWTSLWSHAIRRVNVPHVSRAACHAANIFIASNKLPSARVLGDIEALANDLTVQGPPFPYDSVCIFLGECLKIAGQDVRLYRMQLEEKVMSWLSSTWNVVNGTSKSQSRSRLEAHSLKDVLALFEVICTLPKRNEPVCSVLLPEGAITDRMIYERSTAVIRDYLLQARLPRFKAFTPTGPVLPATAPETRSADFALPTAREAHVSTFLQRSLEMLTAEWDGIKEADTKTTAEKVRRSIDFVVLSLSLQASLLLNGTRSNRRVVQAALKLLALLRPSLHLKRWSPKERATVILGLEPLVGSDALTNEDERWEVMLEPRKGSGIKMRTLAGLINRRDGRAHNLRVWRMEAQKLLWENSDAQEAFTDLLSDVKLALRAALGPEPATNTADSQSTEDGDDFGEARPSDVDTHQYLTDSAKGESYFTAISVEVCFAVLTVGPMIQSKSSEPTRDKTLIDLTLDASDQHFETLGLPLFDTVRRRKLYLGLANMDKFLHRFDTLLRTHASSRRESMQLLAISFLDSTSHTWLDEKNRGEEVASKVRALCFWLTEMLAENKITSWKIRDRLVRFLDRYIRHDPLETFWKYDDGDMVDDNVLPSSILPALGDDADVRVRFRVAVLCAKLFHFAEYTDTDPMQLYDSIRKKLGVRIDKRENMLTRFLALGNIMVASSAVRRGPYWHLIETFFYTVDYSSHIEAVLAAVSERLGLPALRNLFEAYASQIVFSAFTSSKDFARVPSHILGYSDRREYSEASFILICPTFLLAGGGNPEAVALGEQLFENQCRAAQKTIEEGLNDCFGDLVGLQIAFYFEDNVDGEDLSASVSQGGSDFLKLSIENRARACDSNEDATVFIRKNVDRIVFSMVRSLLDMDISREGAIVAALQSEPDSARAVRAFRSLASYRKGEDFRVHSPNKPGVSAITILRSIRWLSKLAPDAMSKETVYHVLHHLFAAADRSPLVNEQIRLLNATCLLCALNNSAFEDVIVLRTLILGSVAMLSQFDLAAAAQCILEWSFQFYRTTDIRDPCFPDVLSRIGRIASDYASEANVACHTLGERLMDWIEKLASGLHSVDTLRPQILSALPLWPRPPTGDLAELARDLDSDNVSHILKDQNVTSSKFRLVRRLRDLAFVEGAPLQEFSRHDFWHLKAHIPPSEILQDEDIDAFVALLYANKGQIQTVSDNRSSIRAVDVRHQRATRTSKGEFRQTPSAISIVTSLFDMLSSDTMSQVHVAYMTLRHIAAVNSSMRSDSQKWPAEIKPEVRFYSDNPLAALWRPKRSLQELEHDKYLETTSNFTTWITCVTLLFSDVLSETDMLYAQLTDILQSDTVFAEHMLPVLVCDLLVTDFRSDPPVTTCRASLSGFFTRILRLQSAALQCVSAVVEVVLHLRNFDQPAQTDKLGYNQWLDVDFTLLAQGAMSCGAYTTALLFLELAREYEESPDVAQRPTLAEDILFNIYSHIDEPDGFYGIQTKDVSKFLLRRFHHEKQWGKAFQFLGANLEAESGTSQNAPGVLQSLHSFGFHKLAMTVLQSSGSGTGDGERQSSGLGYDLGWRTETWDLPNPDLNEHPTGALYSALRAVHRERDSDAIDTTIRRALRHEVLRLRSFGNEDMTQIREATRSLMCLGEITNWRGSSIQDKLQRRDMDHPSWSNFCSLSSEFDFPDFEAIVATRTSLLRAVRQREMREQIGNISTPFAQGLKKIEQACLIRLSEAARKTANLQISVNAISSARHLQQAQEYNFDSAYEFANVLWMQNEKKMAVETLRGLVQDAEIKGRTPERKQAILLSCLGEWASEACLEQPLDIRQHFFEPASKMLDAPSTEPSLAIVFHRYALFAEHQYQAILRSPEVARLKLYVDRKTIELEQVDEKLKRLRPMENSGALAHHQRKARLLLDQDKAQYSVHTDARAKFLLDAILMYSRCLVMSDEYDSDASIHLCSLWFSNFNSDDLNESIGPILGAIPSRKFVFLAHQLSARISSSDQGPGKAQRNLQSVMARLCREHPFHSLYQVYLLRQNGVDTTRNRRTSRATDEIPSAQKDRAAAAAQLFQSLRHDASAGPRVRDLEALCDAYLEWAQFPIKGVEQFNAQKQAKEQFKIPQHLKIRKLTNLQVPVSTLATPVDPTCRYEDIISISRYSEKFSTAGGINLPKITDCLGSDGDRYKQLFKGEGDDDLRQDAVMEQVFELVNHFLQHDRETKKRNLSIRPYKVIPLASQAGLLEFVQNTTVMARWLQDAHTRYRPQDWGWFRCHRYLKKVKEEGGRNESQLRQKLYNAFVEIRQNLKPVMRHFFTEKHRLPIAWFAMRLNYSRSVATTSIVGHVLGLGDRHVSNILIDNNSGEVVHIDLGIAFDQGRLLPVPELVPFRLTADMVDGFGSSGTEGVFRRSSEETLRVLRDRSDVIKTVLEVFRYDPLHSWTANPLKIQRVQATPDGTHVTNMPTIDSDSGLNLNSDDVEESADRALNGVARKLDKSLSVEYTVNELISTASDIGNLSQIFIGWSPYF